MRSVVYMMITSFDGFVEGPDGRFDWCHPDEQVHRFCNQLASATGTILYGRRMYEMMAVWQTLDQDPSTPDYVREFARIWKSKPKFIFSTTLESVGEGCTLVRGDIGGTVARLKELPGGDIEVSGPGLASALARLDLIDEYRVILFPVLVGGGKRYFPGLDQQVPLRLLETRSFDCGAVYLRYGRG